MPAVLSLTALLVSASCDPRFHYGSSDPEKVKAFLAEQNILRATDEETILALIDWSRRNLVHYRAEESVRGSPPTILELIEKGRKEGYITIEGCWGTASFYEQVLGAAGIQAVYSTVEIGGQLHASVEFPLLGKSAIHADDLHRWRVSTRTGEVPPGEILVPSVRLAGDNKIGEVIQKQNADIIDRFLPDISTLFRIAQYGRFYTEEEIRKDASGEGTINDVTVDPQVLKKLDAEVDRLGGPANARQILKQVIDFPELHKEFVPLPKDKSYKTDASGE